MIFALVLAFYLPTWYDEYKSSRSRKMMEALTSKCPIPEEGVNICCYEGGVMSLCNNKDSFKCGERIELRIRLKKIDIPSYICINQTFHPPPPIEPTDFTVFYSDALFTCSEDPMPDPDVLIPVNSLPVDFLLSGIVYNTTGLRKLVEVRIFPIKNYTTVANLLEDLESSKIVLEVEKMIVC